MLEGLKRGMRASTIKNEDIFLTGLVMVPEKYIIYLLKLHILVQFLKTLMTYPDQNAKWYGNERQNVVLT